VAKKKGISDTLERFKEKAHHFQKNLQHSKSWYYTSYVLKFKGPFTRARFFAAILSFFDRCESMDNQKCGLETQAKTAQHL
jgi:hypothetical protein